MENSTYVFKSILTCAKLWHQLLYNLFVLWYTPSLPSQVAVVGLFLKLHSYWCLKRKMLVQNTFSIIYSFSNLVFLQSLLLCSLFCTYCWLINLREANKQKFQCHKQQFYKSLAYTTQELFQSRTAEFQWPILLCWLV